MSEGEDSHRALREYLEGHTFSGCTLCCKPLATSFNFSIATCDLSKILLPVEYLRSDKRNHLVPLCSSCNDVTSKLTQLLNHLQRLQEEFCLLRDQVGLTLITSYAEHAHLAIAQEFEKWSSVHKEMDHIYPHLIEDHIKQLSSKSTEVLLKTDPSTDIPQLNSFVKIEVEDADHEDLVDFCYPQSNESPLEDNFDLEDFIVAPNLSPYYSGNDVKLTKMKPVVVVNKLSPPTRRVPRIRPVRRTVYVPSDDEPNYDSDNDYSEDDVELSVSTDSDMSSSPDSPAPTKSSNPKPKSKTAKATHKCSICSQTFNKRYFLQQHDRKHFSNGQTSSCTHCDSSFTNQRYRRRHLINTHALFSPETDFKCPFCLKRYEQCHTRNRHLLEVHEFSLQTNQSDKDISFLFTDPLAEINLPSSIKCNFCLSKPTFQTVQDLEAHEDSAVHMEAILKRINIHCALCKVKFKSVDQLKNHLESPEHSQEIQKYSSVDKHTFCLVCKQSFDSRKELLVHNQSNEHRRAYEDVRYILNYGEPRKKKSALLEASSASVAEAQVFEGPQRFECKICGKSFARGGGLNLHMEVVHADGGYACEFCGKTFKTSTDFKSHRRLHLNEITKPFQCDKCEKSFLNKKSLENHVQIHEGLTYQCEQCGKTFLALVFLTKHVKFFHAAEGKSVPQYASKCSECSEVFSKSDILRKHMVTAHPQVYLKNKPFYCKVCFKNFLTEEEILDQHMAAHDAHKCKFCGKYFRWKKGLDKHLRTHTGERPFICTFCSKGFMSQDNLKEHVYSHTGERPYKCDKCDKGFIRSGIMKKHMQLCAEGVKV